MSKPDQHERYRYSALLSVALVLMLMPTPGRLCAQSEFYGQPSSILFAQEYPFDSNVYFPSIGVRDEIEERKGTMPEQFLGRYVRNIGPKPGDVLSRIAISGLQTGDKLSVLSPRENFSLGSLGAKHWNLDPSNYGERWYCQPLHRSDRRDLFVMNHLQSIFWADSAGNYDSSRYTRLITLADTSRNWNIKSNAFFFRVNTDDVLDVIYLVGVRHNSDPNSDSLYAIVFYGGQELRSKASAFPDEILYCGPGVQDSRRYSIQANFSGNGRSDLITATGKGDLFYYEDRAPFSLSRFIHSIMNDTLLAAWEQDSNYGRVGHWLEGAVSMRAIAKSSDDTSEDLVANVRMSNELREKAKVRVFRGGKHFGSKRLRLESADFVIRAPSYLNPAFNSVYFGSDLKNCGDMSGNGDQVLHVGGSDWSTAYNFYYVLGPSIDEKADMTYFQDNASGISDMDTGDLNLDGLTDFIYGQSGHGTKWQGLIHVVYGSKAIPSKRKPAGLSHSTGEQHRVRSWPNPASTVLNIEVGEDLGSGQLTVRNALGMSVYEALNVGETISLDISMLANGTYSYALKTAQGYSEGRFVVFR